MHWLIVLTISIEIEQKRSANSALLMENTLFAIFDWDVFLFCRSRYSMEVNKQYRTVQYSAVHHFLQIWETDSALFLQAMMPFCG
jgi:hypothetical protein